MRQLLKQNSIGKRWQETDLVTMFFPVTVLLSPIRRRSFGLCREMVIRNYLLTVLSRVAAYKIWVKVDQFYTRRKNWIGFTAIPPMTTSRIFECPKAWIKAMSTAKLMRIHPYIHSLFQTYNKIKVSNRIGLLNLTNK